MPFDILTITWEHQHECSRRGETVEQRPPCKDGVAYYAAPVCIESGLTLSQITWETA